MNIKKGLKLFKILNLKNCKCLALEEKYIVNEILTNKITLKVKFEKT